MEKIPSYYLGIISADGYITGRYFFGEGVFSGGHYTSTIES